MTLQHATFAPHGIDDALGAHFWSQAIRVFFFAAAFVYFASATGIWWLATAALAILGYSALGLFKPLARRASNVNYRPLLRRGGIALVMLVVVFYTCAWLINSGATPLSVLGTLGFIAALATCAYVLGRLALRLSVWTGRSAGRGAVSAFGMVQFYLRVAIPVL